MADENVTTNAAQETQTPETAAAPTMEELTAQLAQMTAERDKYKGASDKASKEAAENKRKLVETKNELMKRQTEEEKKAEAEAEAERLRNERYEAMEKELNHNRAINAYRSIPDEGLVENLIDAVSEANHGAIAGVIDRIVAAKVKEAQAEWQKSRPRVNVGAGDGGYTKEQFEKMTTAEKSKLYRENKAEYDRLIG